MKLAQILERLADSPSSDKQDMVDWHKQITKDCSSFLSKVSKPLWRGMNIKSSMVRQLETGFYICAVRPDRRAKDSSESLTADMNAMFTKAIGLPLRTASLFTSFEKSLASNYTDASNTETCMIFPIGKFHYAWSPEIDDPYTKFEEEWGDFRKGSELSRALLRAAHDTGQFTEYDDNDDVNWYEAEDHEEILNQFFQKYAEPLYKFDEGLKEAEGTGNEIMIVCDKFYAVSSDYLRSEHDMSGPEFFEMLKK